MSYAKFFDVPFASSGSLTPVPDTVQVSGSVSYPSGWGPYYAQDPATYPATALLIDRAQTNQLFFDVTSAVQQLQNNQSGAFVLQSGAWVSNTTATWTGTLLGQSYSQTLNTATSGAGGLDTGSLAASTWYYVYAIYNPATTTPGVLMSLSATAPTLPSGYTFSSLIGTVYSDGSSHLAAFKQVGNRISFPKINVLSTTTVQSSWTSLSIASAVPPNAKTCNGILATTGGTASQNVFIAADASGTGEQQFESAGSGSTSSGTFAAFSIISPQTVYYIANDGAGSGTANFSIFVSSYTI